MTLDLLTHWLYDWLTDVSTDWYTQHILFRSSSIHQPTDRPTDRLTLVLTVVVSVSLTQYKIDQCNLQLSKFRLTFFVCLFVLAVRSTEIINLLCRHEKVEVIVLLTVSSTKALYTYSDVIVSSVLCEMRPSQHASDYLLRLVSLQTCLLRLHRYHRHYVRQMIWAG